jgi:hypothetical protein
MSIVNIRERREVKLMLWELLVLSEAIRKLLDKIQNRRKKNKNEKNFRKKLNHQHQNSTFGSFKNF